MLHEALFELEFDLDQGLDKDDLFIILKYLDYACAKDESFVTTYVFNSLNLPVVSW
jgi:hypothetical protein